MFAVNPLRDATARRSRPARLAALSLGAALVASACQPVSGQSPTETTGGVRALTAANVPTSPALDVELQVSATNDRRSPRPLSGTELRGTAFVFAQPVGSGRIESVRFWIDDPNRTGTPRQVETWAAYDLAGTGSYSLANPFATTVLRDGNHQLTVQVRGTDGSLHVETNAFTVRNGSATSTTQAPTTTTAKPTTTTAAPSTPTTGRSSVTTVPPTTSSTIAPTTSTSLPTAATRTPAMWPFTASSPWNMPIGSGATFETADATATRNLLDPAFVPWVNAGRYSHPVRIATNADPLATVRWDNSNTAPWQWGQTQYRVPLDATAAPGTDGHLHIVDAGGRYLHESFQMTGAGTDRRVNYYVRTDLCGNGMSQRGYGYSDGTRAYGGSAIGGLIRTWELQQGEVRHALALALTAGQLKRGPVWPATVEDGDAAWSYYGQIPMGSFVAIPPSVNVETLGLTREGLIVAQALQRYGAYVVDRAGAFALYVEQAGEGPMTDNIRRDMARIRAQMRIVTNNSADAVGGPGTRRAPLAPALDAPC